ncbi:MAG: helix-turn-helix domain-containing protein, partial [Atopobiaceae bacterium]|nr:helix-turn-helix domain-containing protein [Atopobiaceae bacterium]
MIEFGKTLRSAREAKGLTVEQLAKATCLLPHVVEDLEKEDFSRLPAPIYGRGFVKLYCEQVGLDPKPMVAEFMDILNGGSGAGA